LFFLYVITVSAVFGAIVWLILKQDKQQKGETNGRESLIRSLQIDNENLKNEVSALKKTSQEPHRELNDLKMQIQQKSSELDKVDKALKADQQSKIELNKTLAELEKTLNNKTEQSQKIELELKQSQAETKQTQDELKKIKDSLNAKDNALKLKDEEIARLKTDISNLKKEMELPNQPPALPRAENHVPVIPKTEEKTVSEKLFQIKPAPQEKTDQATPETPAKESSLKKIVKEVLEKEKADEQISEDKQNENKSQ